VLRPANVYGRDRSHDKPQGVVEHWLARLRAGQELISWNDTSVVRDYIHVDDVTAALIASLHRPVVEPFVNVGTGIGTSLRDLAELMQRVTGITVRLTASASHHPALSRNVLSTALMEKCLGIAPRVSLEEGIARTWASIAARGVKSDAAD
ncbi:MAG: NAD-dependent epimerase/dehydratase family protein, partial [Flavobacteriales bacterium]|nr:NAD-dependent epimerase/dehydratase family protein [Flavobacteriales bacterium]